MKHPDNIRAVLKRASLSEASELDADQLKRAEMVAAGEVGSKQSGPALANFIMKGGKGGAAKSSRVKGKMSMAEAAKQILSRARGPLHAKEVYERAKKQGLIDTDGATPEQTMAARLATGTRKGDFKRTAPNTFTLPGKSAGKAKKGKRAKAAAAA